VAAAYIAQGFEASALKGGVGGWKEAGLPMARSES
jgi:rhodanese-related sulfurtransferase